MGCSACAHKGCPGTIFTNGPMNSSWHMALLTPWTCHGTQGARKRTWAGEERQRAHGEHMIEATRRQNARTVAGTFFSLPRAMTANWGLRLCLAQSCVGVSELDTRDESLNFESIWLLVFCLRCLFKGVQFWQQQKLPVKSYASAILFCCMLSHSSDCSTFPARRGNLSCHQQTFHVRPHTSEVRGSA
jgi:hypothetical protein